MKNLIKQCLEYFKSEIEYPLAENTLKAYQRDLLQFNDYMQANQKEQPEQISKSLINDYKKELQKQGKAISSINRKIIALNRFLFYLREVKGLAVETKAQIIRIQTQDFKADLLSNNDVKRILRAADKKNDVRTKTLILTLFYTGARISEALQIKINDIDKDKIQIKGKGSKYRWLYIPKKLKKVFAEYMEVRKDGGEYLFTGTRGALTRTTANHDIKYYAGQARLKKDKAHPHALRHLYTKNIYNLGLNPGIIKQLLGHSLNTTDLYLSVGEKDLLNIINKLDFNGAEK